METQRLAQLLDDYFDGTLTPADKIEFEHLLLQYPAARALFWQRANDEALFEQWGEQHWGEQGLKLLRPLPAPRWRRWVAAGLAAAAVVVAGFVLWRPDAPTERGARVAEATSADVAVLAQSAEAVWEGRDFPAGAALAPGWLRLKTGLIAVEFLCGARVIIEGPAEFQILSETEAFCQSGRLRADVPPEARGFKIGTPQVTVVDLGTEFGLDVKRDGKAVVKVISGEVELHQSAGKQDLKEGAAVAVDGAGVMRPTEAGDELFPAERTLAERDAVVLARRRDAWRAGLAEVASWAGLVAHYTFETNAAGERKLPNSKPTGEGSIVGAQWVTGRWPGKGALELLSATDRVRIEVPGESPSLSLAAWVRVDRLANRNNALLMSDGFGTGAVHWQIREDGCLILGMHGRGVGVGADYVSPPVIDSDRSVRWTFLAVVMDEAAGEVRHYVDAQVVATLPMKPLGPLHIGTAEIGNWNPAHRADKRPIRNFHGRIDEVLVFNRALAPTELVRLYSLGRPEL